MWAWKVRLPLKCLRKKYEKDIYFPLQKAWVENLNIVKYNSFTCHCAPNFGIRRIRSLTRHFCCCTMRFEHAHAQGIIQRLQMSLQGWAKSRPGSRLSRSWLFRRVVSVVSFISSLRGRRKKGRGWRKGEREKGIQSNPIESSSPFSLPPYPLPPTPFDACYAGNFMSYPGNRGTENKYFAIRKLKSLFSDFFNRTRNSETKFGFLIENPYLQGIRTDSWKIRGAPS